MVTWWITDASEDDEGGDHGWSAGRGGGVVVGNIRRQPKPFTCKVMHQIFYQVSDHAISGCYNHHAQEHIDHVAWQRYSVSGGGFIAHEKGLLFHARGKLEELPA